ncbi:DUF523 and DUF1722 domain-containing protein [Desulfocurvus sp.]|jgi:uncharacterized protein YbgA (DUF1722 family)/uncharacterized protein YbbK (DUF523 family)|uniref:YbgA family protein n=1 Tax=Desulfocurvus sp. TaxID=2871698 RepID=UPI0025B7F002|nr:DUF523 and DUF1722 domain-containing protein [Desulfocurvus sp.]MCK9239007.1 DUF523 and DUF1722 domain-containing protein [Desulfocurvus sp.]
MTDEGRIRLGIARCLLGDPVRYDGTHKLDRTLRDVLGRFVEWVAVCPEVECGMPVPREAVRLVGDPAAPRLLGRNSGTDFTGQMRAWGQRRLEALADEGLCGYVFRYGSPSSGMSRVKVYPEAGGPARRDGVGLWAGMVMARFPELPFEDDGRLHDPAIRENFITRVFTLMRWRQAMADGPSPRALVDFHTRHKLLLMAHSVELYRELGRLVAEAGGPDARTLPGRYFPLLQKALSLLPTTRKHTNVLSHVQGYFKRVLSADERQELTELVGRYHAGLVPLVVPVTLLNHYVRKYGQDYLAAQVYLNPYPAELMLRNHV